LNDIPRKEGFIEEKPVVVTEPAIEPSPAEAPQVVELWPIVVKLLHKSVRNNAGIMVKELTFREPTGGDINRYGNPVRVNQDGDVVIDERKMHFMMAALSGILPPFIEQLDPRDWNSCAYRLRGFFLPDPQAW